MPRRHALTMGVSTSLVTNGTVELEFQSPIPTQRIAIHHLDTFGDQIVTDSVGFGEVLCGTGFLALGEGGFNVGFFYHC